MVCNTPSHGSDHLYLIWKKSIHSYWCYRVDTACGMDGRTDRRMERRTDGVKPVYPTTTSLCGEYNNDMTYRTFLPLPYRFHFRRHIFVFFIISQHCDDTSFRSYLVENTTQISCISNIMAADDLFIEGAQELQGSLFPIARQPRASKTTSQAIRFEQIFSS